jgi:transposase
VEAVLYRYRAGIPWRDLPERFGDPIKIHTRFSRWAKSGVWNSQNRRRQGCGSRGCRTGCSQIRRGTDVVMSGLVESGHCDIDAYPRAFDKLRGKRGAGRRLRAFSALLPSQTTMLSSASTTRTTKSITAARLSTRRLRKRRPNVPRHPALRPKDQLLKDQICRARSQTSSITCLKVSGRLTGPPEKPSFVPSVRLNASRLRLGDSARSSRIAALPIGAPGWPKHHSATANE